jgi:hypothetical protein
MSYHCPCCDNDVDEEDEVCNSCEQDTEILNLQVELNRVQEELATLQAQVADFKAKFMEKPFYEKVDTAFDFIKIIDPTAFDHLRK